MPPVGLLYYPVLVFRDQNDMAIPFAKVYSYLAGTTTPTSLYANASGTTPLSNPAIASASGQLLAYGPIGTAFKIDVFDQNSVHVPGFPVDNIILSLGGDPALLEGYDSVAEMRLTLDPGEVGTEVVPSSLQEWQQQIQFVLKERGRVNQWYESYTIRTLHNLQVLLSMVTDIPNLFPPTGLTTQYHTVQLPDGWRPQTNLTWVFDRKSTSGVGTAIMNYAVNRERSGQAVANIVTTTAINFAPGSGNMQRVSTTIPGSGLLAGDRLVMTLQRDGDNAGDTDAGNVLMLGSDVVYTGLAGS